jgi:hypothetical protein
LGEKINGKHYVSVDCYLILDENSFSYIHDEKFYKEIFEDFDVAYLLRKYFFFFFAIFNFNVHVIILFAEILLIDVSWRKGK